MIEESDLITVIECHNCNGTGEFQYDNWNRCDCESNDCAECKDREEWDDDWELECCDACGGSGVREDMKKCLNEFFAKWRSHLSREERETIRDFLLRKVYNEELSTFDVCEMIDAYNLSE